MNKTKSRVTAFIFIVSFIAGIAGCRANVVNINISIYISLAFTISVGFGMYLFFHLKKKESTNAPKAKSPIDLAAKALHEHLFSGDRLRLLQEELGTALVGLIGVYGQDEKYFGRVDFRAEWQKLKPNQAAVRSNVDVSDLENWQKDGGCVLFVVGFTDSNDPLIYYHLRCPQLVGQKRDNYIASKG